MKKGAALSILVVVAMLAVAVLAEAQQPKKISRIGYLGFGARRPDRVEAFRQGLRDLGYVEGKNIFIEWRSAEGHADRLPALAAELIRLKVDLIVTNGPYSTRAAKAATVTVPIVMGTVGDPVGDGIIVSLARPGGNITGLSSVAPELSGKRLELLKEIVPKLSRVAVFGSPTNPNNAGMFREVELAAGALKVKVQFLDVLTPKEFETAFRSAVKAHAEAVLPLGGSLFASQRRQVVELAVKNRLPAIYGNQITVEAGGLMSYGVNILDLDRRIATYVDKILKGAKPAELPVEQPMKFDFVINLKAAKQIGLTIPPNVLVRADRVIK